MGDQAHFFLNQCNQYPSGDTAGFLDLVDNLGRGFVAFAVVGLAEDCFVAVPRVLFKVGEADIPVATVGDFAVEKLLNVINAHRAALEKLIIADDVARVERFAEGKHSHGPVLAVVAAGKGKERGRNELIARPNQRRHTVF